MKAYLSIPAALALLLLGGNASPAQFGRPAFRPPPVYHPPVHVPPPHMPTHTPTHTPSRRGVFEEEAPSGLDFLNRREADRRRAENSKRAAQLAGTVGLLAAPGQGPMLEPSTLFPGAVVQPTRWHFTYHRPVDPQEVALAASSVGLLASPQGQGPLLRAATLLPPPGNDGPREKRVELKPKWTPDAARGKEERPANGGNPDHTFFWVIPGLIVGGILVIVVRAAMSQNSTEATPGTRVRVRIAATPPGDAPESIRRAWVGLELPACVDRPNAGAVGVLSNRAVPCRESYAINGAEAVALLADWDPGAAAWWRTNAPHVLRGGYQLVFPAEVCEVL